MLKITIPKTEAFNNETQEFITFKEQTIALEHSLVSISKWEAKWHKPWFQTDPKKTKTLEETRDYIRCMTLTQNVKPEAYYLLTQEHLKEIQEYINDPQTATWFSQIDAQGNNKRTLRLGQVITSEIIYYWMITFGVPFECQKWHLNRLLTLINVCGEKNKPQKKMSRKAVANQYAALNAARRKQFNSTG